MNRKNILTGPGAAKYDGVTLHDADGINVTIDSATQDIVSSVSGPMDTIKTDQQGTVTLAPCGVLTQAILDILFPHQNPAIGSRIFGDADKPMLVNGIDGKQVKLFNAALTGVPELRLSTIQTLFGQATFTALIADGKSPDATDAFYAVATVPYADGVPDPTGITGTPYTATFGTLTLPDTLDGWTITIELATQPITTDNIGTVDLLLTGITIRAACTPLGKSVEEILNALPVNKLRGASARTNNDLIIAGQGGGLKVTLCNAALLTGPIQWGNTQLRIGQIGFIAHRRFSDGQLYKVEISE